MLTSNGRAVPASSSGSATPATRAVATASARSGRGRALLHFGLHGWLATGDLGRLDDRGYLTLVGRLGDGIIRGGENVFPLEVERVLERTPASPTSRSWAFRTVAWASESRRRWYECTGMRPTSTS